MSRSNSTEEEEEEEEEGKEEEEEEEEEGKEEEEEEEEEEQGRKVRRKGGREGRESRNEKVNKYVLTGTYVHYLKLLCQRSSTSITSTYVYSTCSYHILPPTVMPFFTTSPHHQRHSSNYLILIHIENEPSQLPVLDDLPSLVQVALSVGRLDLVLGGVEG